MEQAFNPLNAELNPICHLLALLGAHHILHISRIRVNKPYPSMECKCMMKDNDQIIKYLKNTKNSYGCDKIFTKILKISSPFTSSPLNYICNKIIFWGIFPDRLKYAVIKPLHKNDDRCDVSNYRPVSLLTSFSKICEIVM